MSTQKTVVLTCGAISQTVLLPGSFSALLHLLAGALRMPVSTIIVLYSTEDGVWYPVSEGTYLRLLRIPVKSQLKLTVRKKQVAKWTINYALSFVGRNCIKVQTLDTGAVGFIHSPVLHWSGRVCMSASDSFFFSGGCENPRSAYELDLMKGEERQLADMLRGRMWHAVCCHDEAVYAVGGREKEGGRPTNTAEALVAGLWVPLPGMVYPRESLSLTAHGTAVYAFGGFGGETRLSTIEKYEGKWGLLSWEMPEPLQMVGVCFVSDHCLILAGGQDDKTEHEAVWEVNAQTGEAKSLPPLPRADYFTGRQLFLRSDCLLAFAHFQAQLHLPTQEWRLNE